MTTTSEHHSIRDLTGERWRRRAVLAALVRSLAVLAPIVASLAAGFVMSRVLPRPDGTLGSVLWLAVVLCCSMGALLAVDRGARRLLPLALLLRLSLVFPDAAPSRFSVALRAGSARKLAAAARDAADGPLAHDPETIVVFAAALNAHDRRTRGHSERVRGLSDLLGAELGVSEADAERLRWAAFLHDIGKLSIPAKVLNKPGRLDAREWAIVRGHPAAGQLLVTSLEDWLGDWGHAIHQHHEKFDGSGYPAGLAGDEISLAGRIVAVADSFETMTAVRSYNKPMSPADGRAEVTRCAGSHFDPRVVRAMLGISIMKLRWKLGIAASIAQIPFLGMPARAGAQAATSAAGIEANAGSLAGAFAIGVAGIATPLMPVAVMSAWATEDSPRPTAPADATDRGADNEPSTADGASTASTASSSDAALAEAATVDGDDPDADGSPTVGAGPGAGSGPGNGAAQGRGGPGAGDGPGNGAGQGGGAVLPVVDPPGVGIPGVPNGGVGQGNGNSGNGNSGNSGNGNSGNGNSGNGNGNGG